MISFLSRHVICLLIFLLICLLQQSHGQLHKVGEARAKTKDTNFEGKRPNETECQIFCSHKWH